ncbi:MAG: excinuclease ABC subunit UvrC [Verrucomicrobiaceae bacterium]|nr:MAG: excinuclease ABC subunit UvrC [Verrucomicrobiaceae bacterium]
MPDEQSVHVPREKADFKAKLHDVPHKPGVYLMRDRFRRVIYVGKARDLRRRVSNYFMPSKKMTADPKTRALIDAIWDFEWHTVLTEPESLLLEGRLIKEYRPRYNVSFRDDKRFLLVKVDMRDDWPRFRLTRLRAEDGARYFGPFAHAGALRQTLSFMRKRFGVLTFGRGNPTERELKSSTYQVPMKLANITTEQYRERVEKACEFFEGKSKDAMEALEEEMKKAAAKLDFERAAEIRNMLDDLRKTTAPMRRFTREMGHRLKVPSNVNPADDVRALQDALQLEKPPRHMECFDISNISATHIVASMVCFKDGVPDKANYRRYRIKTVEGQNDFASMAEVVRRRYSRVLLEGREQAERMAEEAEKAAPDDEEEGYTDALVDYSASQESPVEQMERIAEAQAELRDSQSGSPFVRLPDLVIVDGGKGQLSSACKELQRLGLSELPIIGLAKEFEEIYRPSRPLPLRLPESSGALRLLQRIRDEAHRFANGFHQLLMKRRIAESVLDDCPGVSQNRKQILLQRFGSVARIKRATPEQIAEIEGIGPRLAQQIHEFVNERLR